MFGVTTWTLPVRGIAALAWAAAHGFTLVHVDSADLDGPDTEHTQAFVERSAELGVTLAGLAISQLESVGIDDLPDARRVIDGGLRLARDLAIDFVYLPSFAAAEIRTSAHLRRTAELLTYAAENTGQSMIVATENTLDVDETRRLLCRVKHPRVRLLIDTQNPCLWGHQPAALAVAFADRLGPYVHAKDGRARGGDTGIGAGAADVAGTVDALGHVSFAGSFVLESDYRLLPHHQPGADQRALTRLLCASDLRTHRCA